MFAESSLIGNLIFGVFKVILTLIETIVSPILIGIIGLFPVLSQIFNYALVYVTNIITYIPLCCSFLMIPRVALTMLFDYFVVKYTIYLTIRGVTFTIRMIQAFKVL